MNNMKKNIALVMGGFSGEHDISIASGNQVYGQLDHTKYNVYKIVIDRVGWYWLDGEEHRPVDRGNFTVTDKGQTIHFDLAFIIIHGNPGENGVLQGYFDMLGIRYTTCGFYTSSLTFHKGYCNPVVKSFGLVKVAKSVLLYKEPPTETKLDELMEGMHYPVFVKPAAGGSSVATTKVKSREALLPAIREAFTEDHQVLVEEFIPGREFDCGVMQFPKGSKYEGWNPDFKHNFARNRFGKVDHLRLRQQFFTHLRCAESLRCRSKNDIRPFCQRIQIVVQAALIHEFKKVSIYIRIRIPDITA